MIVGLAGYARAGKDTVGSILVEDYGFKRIALADKMKEALAILNPYVDNPKVYDDWGYLTDIYGDPVDWEQAKADPYVRRLLQRFGTEVGRNLFGPDFWIKQAFKDINWAFQTQPIVVTDVRFPNEASHIKWLNGGKTFWIKRPGIKPANGHVSELAMLPEMCDGIIYNDQDKNYMKRLKDQVERKIINGE